MIGKYLLTGSLAVLLSVSGATAGNLASERFAPLVREELDLGGEWRTRLDADNQGEKEGYFEAKYDTGGWRRVNVPGSFANVAPEIDRYEGVGWYKRAFQIPGRWRGKRVVLRFEGVNNQAKVWVNGQLVGMNPDAYLRFEFPIEHASVFGQDNVIAVRVDNTRRHDVIPGGRLGWHPYGGIVREVGLVATDLFRIEAVRITAEPSGDDGKLTFQAGVANGDDHAIGGRLEVKILGAERTECAAFTIESVKLGAGEEKSFAFSGIVADAEAWSPERPVLYTARIQLRAGERIVDARSVRFGFRRIEAKNAKLYLNDKPIFLTGFNRHEDSPVTDMCPDHELTRAELLAMKRDFGANFLRLCHYPQHPRTIDMCDETGLLVMCEIPLYMWPGLKKGKSNYLETVESAKGQLRKMINRDFNHPSVIFWSVSNEIHTEYPEVLGTNVKLLMLAKKLDSSRLAVHVSDQGRWQSHEGRKDSFGEDDVICVNGYPNPGSGAKFWAKHLAELHQDYPDKPILVTEFGDTGDKQVRAIRAGFEGITAPYVCGTVIWCWADHPWDKSWLEPPLSPYGVYTRERRPRESVEVVKKGFAEARRRFAAMQ